LSKTQRNLGRISKNKEGGIMDRKPIAYTSEKVVDVHKIELAKKSLEKNEKLLDLWPFDDIETGD